MFKRFLQWLGFAAQDLVTDDSEALFALPPEVRDAPRDSDVVTEPSPVRETDVFDPNHGASKPLRASCKRKDGRAKVGYATKKLAESAKRSGMRVYRCKEHGWHVGHELTRALRGQLVSAKKASARKRSAKKATPAKKK